MAKRKREILGLLIICLGAIIFTSELFYNPIEEPTINPEIAINIKEVLFIS